ncbi:caspase family protein [Bacteroidota bacterium]
MNSSKLINIIFLFIAFQSFGQYKISQQAGNKAIWDIKFSPDNEYLAIAAEDGLLLIWDLKNDRQYHKLTGPTRKLSSIVFDPSGEIMATGGDDEIMRLWNWKQGTLIREFGVPKADSNNFIIGARNVYIRDLAFTPDGKTLLMSGSNMSGYEYHIQLWNPESGNRIKTLSEHSSLMQDIEISSDGKKLVSVACDGTVKLWDLEKQVFVKNIAQSLGEVYKVDISPDGKWVAAGGNDRYVRVWNIETGKKVYEFGGHLSGVSGLEFHPDGKYLASCSYDKSAIIWDLEKNTEIIRYSDFTDGLTTLDFSPDGKHLAFGCNNGTFIVKEFKILSPEDLSNQFQEENDIPEGIQKRIYATTDIPFSNLSKPPLLVFEKGMHSSEVSQSKFHPNGKEIITASWDKTIRIWSAEDGTLLRIIHVPTGVGLEGQIFALDVSPDGKMLIVAGSSLGQQNTKQTEEYIGDYVLLIDYATGKISDIAADHTQSIFGIAFSSDGNYIASGGGSYDNRVILYKLNKSSKKLQFVGEQDVAKLSLNYFPSCEQSNKSLSGVCSQRITRIAFIPNSQDVVSTDEYGMLFKFSNNLTNAKLIGESLSRKSASILGSLTSKEMFRSLAVDPNGKFIAAGDLNGLTYFFDPKGNPAASETKSYEKALGSIPAFHNRAVFALAISPDGNKIAVAIHKRIKVFKLTFNATGQITSEPISSFYKHRNAVLSMSFSPDGKKIVSTGEDPKEVFCWNPENGNVIFQLSKDQKTNMVTAVGIHKENPLLIGFGTNFLSNPEINKHGKINRAFDLGKLQLYENAKHYDFITSLDIVQEYQTPAPSLQYLMMSEPVCSYLPLNEDNTIIGGTYNLYLNYMGFPIFNAGSKVTGLTMSPDKKTFYAAYEKGYIQVYDSRSTKLIATLYISAGNEWIIWTPDGYYAASRNGAKSAAWLTGNGAAKSPGFYPFEQFDLRLNRPDIVLSRIGGMDKKLINALKNAYLKRLRKMGFTIENLVADVTAPTVSISLENKDYEQKNINFTVTAISKKTGLKKLFVYVNDVPLYGTTGKKFEAPAEQSKQDNISLTLSNGSNKIQVSVLNEAGIESLKETRYVNYIGTKAVPDLYLVTIGVSKYMDADYNLTYAAKDANDIANLYKTKQEEFGKIEIIEYNDTNGLKEKILPVKKLLNNSRVDDMVILFVASHGLRDSNSDYFIATHNIDFSDPATQGLSYNDLVGLIDGIPARKKLVMIDACHSGELDEDENVITNMSVENGTIKYRGFIKKEVQLAKRAKPLGVKLSSDLYKELFNDLRRGTGAMVISSAGGGEFAFESPEWNNGVFTYSVLEGLKSGNADSNNDGQIKVSELRDYVFDSVKKLTNGMQNPTSRRENLEYDFKIW